MNGQTGWAPATFLRKKEADTDLKRSELIYGRLVFIVADTSVLKYMYMYVPVWGDI